MKKNYQLPPFPFLLDTITLTGLDFSAPEVEDVDYIDITDIQEEEPGEEAYCVPI